MIEFDRLADAPRLLFQADLKPLQGERFQPTGFPDLGAAEFERPDGTPMLLVESTQSMANRLEQVCWDDERGDLVEELTGLPHVAIDAGDLGRSSTVLEFHRLNSPYLMKDGSFQERLREELGLPKKKKGDDDIPGALDLQRLAATAFKYDPGSVLHGVFLEKIAGRLRLQRLLSAFIEAEDVRPVQSGGVKMDRLDPTGKATGGSKEGFGHVPHHRVEYTAAKITAYFNLDLATLRGYRLGSPAEKLLITLALWKSLRVLETGLRLRTACDFGLNGVEVSRPDDFALPDSRELAEPLRALISECRPQFADPPVTQVTVDAKAG